MRADHLVSGEPLPIDDEFFLTKITPKRHPLNEIPTNNRRGGILPRCENEYPSRGGRFGGGRGGMMTEDHRGGRGGMFMENHRGGRGGGTEDYRGGRGGYRRGCGDMNRDNMPRGGFDNGFNKRGGMMKKRRFNTYGIDTVQQERSRPMRDCEAFSKPTRGGMQRHIRYNPETRRCNQEPFPQKTDEDIPAYDENADLARAVEEACQDYFGLPPPEEATPPMNEKKMLPNSPQRRLSLSFKNSASLDVIEYELEDFAPSP